MDKLVIQGGHSLQGTVSVSGSKNAALPIMAATLLTDEECIIDNFPVLRDTLTMIKLLESLGKEIRLDNHRLWIRSSGKPNHIADYKLVSTMRGSFCVLGPLVAKLRKAQVSLPGGCVIGVRPVDLHLKGLSALGVEYTIDNGYVIADGKNLKGTRIYLGGAFGSSVLATANIMMAATLVEGTTIIECAACEPEIEDLTRFLISMGADIEGTGSSRLIIRGVKQLSGTAYPIIPDRIEAGTFLLMAAATREKITVKGAVSSHLLALLDHLDQAGFTLEEKGDAITIQRHDVIKPVNVVTHPYPGFPTDLQAQFMVSMCLAQGVSVITDKIYPDRFMHVAELNRMGANISRDGMNAIIQGNSVLHGAPVMASDLRASAALVIAGLAAQGRTEISRIYHLERGYENLEEKLLGIGAKITREKEEG